MIGSVMNTRSSALDLSSGVEQGTYVDCYVNQKLFHEKCSGFFSVHYQYYYLGPTAHCPIRKDKAILCVIFYFKLCTFK